MEPIIQYQIRICCSRYFSKYAYGLVRTGINHETNNVTYFDRPLTYVNSGIDFP
jgi:hypothetical protein